MNDPFDSFHDHNKFIVVFDPIEESPVEFIVFFGKQQEERRFAGIADREKINQLLSHDQRKLLRNKETFQFYVDGKKIEDTFEDVYL